MEAKKTSSENRDWYDELYQNENYFGYRRWLYAPYVSAILAKAGVRRSSTVLDVGCGQGFFSHLIRQRADDVLGIDPSSTGIAIARRNYAMSGLTFLAADVHELGPEQRFDCVFVRSLSLYNTVDFSDDTSVTDDLLRRVNPSGVLVFVYNTRLRSDKSNSSWRHHSLQEVRRHFSKYTDARTFFSLKLETLVFRKWAFNGIATRLDGLLSHAFGVGGEVVVFVRQPSIGG